MGKSWTTVSTFMMSAIKARKDAADHEVNLNGDDLPGDILNCLISSWAGLGKYELSEAEVVST